MFLKLLIISALLLLVSFALFGIRILIKETGRFPETHVGRNKEMTKRGIKCAQQTDIGCLPSKDFDYCLTCGSRRL
ncbi:MAG: hypothetical protein WAL29_15510 [Bacteroidales bacterium]